MRILTTCLDKGLVKVPEGHKCDLYALAPGSALQIDDDTRESEVVQITPTQAKRAEYLFALRWVEGRTVAKFKLDGKIYVQPTSPDPLPKKKKRGPSPEESEPAALAPVKPPRTEVTGPQRKARKRSRPLVLLDF